MDETYVKVKGKWQFLYHAVDKEGNTVNYLLKKDLGSHLDMLSYNRCFYELCVHKSFIFNTWFFQFWIFGQPVEMWTSHLKGFSPFPEPQWYGSVRPVVWRNGGSNPASYPVPLFLHFRIIVSSMIQLESSFAGLYKILTVSPFIFSLIKDKSVVTELPKFSCPSVVVKE